MNPASLGKEPAACCLSQEALLLSTALCVNTELARYLRLLRASVVGVGGRPALAKPAGQWGAVSGARLMVETSRHAKMYGSAQGTGNLVYHAAHQ